MTFRTQTLAILDRVTGNLEESSAAVDIVKATLVSALRREIAAIEPVADRRAPCLKAEVEAWFHREFNSIPLAVVEREAAANGGHLAEHIGFPYFDLDDEDGLAAAAAFLNIEIEDGDDGPAVHDEIVQALEDSRDLAYPMWGTVFETRGGNGRRFQGLAEAAGLTFIEGFGDFDDMVGVAGCGYSFYSQHWIPLWLSLPWNTKGRETYAGIDYSGM